MNKSSLIATLATAAMTAMACSAGGGQNAHATQAATTDTATAYIVTVNSAGDTVVTYRPDTARVFYTGQFPKRQSLIVVSKRELRLSVYAWPDGDTLLVARYPVCLSRRRGQKHRSGDMRTPESKSGKPFKITQIQDASNWRHDFGDGRGPILSYGHWFLRLETPFRGIGIHGNTGNEDKMPGRDSEGCIRLRDSDIIHLKENYAWKGMPVIIKAEDQGLLDWESHVKNLNDKGQLTRHSSTQH